MNIITWEQLIKSNKEHIYLVGYGSLLDTNSHHSKKEYLAPVKVKGYKRIFSLSYPEHICEDKEYNKRFISSAKFHNEDYECELNQLSYKKNSGAFEVIRDPQHNLNGLILKIQRKDFNSYMTREGVYELHKVEVDFYNQQDELSKKENIYILVRPRHINEECYFYYLYQKTCRIGAYKISKEFGQEYDKNTFSYNHDLAHKELSKRVFEKGKIFQIRSNGITEIIFPEKKNEIESNNNQKVIIISNEGYTYKVKVLSTNKEILIDASDLSILE